MNKQHTVFIENKGQWPVEVRYLAKTGGMNAWITDNGIVYDFLKATDVENEDKKQDEMLATTGMDDPVKSRDLEYDRQVVWMNLEGIRPNINTTCIDQHM